MDAAAKAPSEEAWAAGEAIVGTKSAKYTGGDGGWQLCLAQWQSSWHAIPQKADPKVKHQLEHILPSAHE